jgi:hypothetical protein
MLTAVVIDISTAESRIGTAKPFCISTGYSEPNDDTAREKANQPIRNSPNGEAILPASLITWRGRQ